MMKHFTIIALSSFTVILAACQTTPRQFNGLTGYEVESKSSDHATIAYTLSSRSNQQFDETKLQRACQKVLNSTQAYKLDILSVNEIANPKAQANDMQAVQLGQSRTSFGLSNTMNPYSNEDYGTRQALENRPSTLQVVRYTCSGK
ncbi:hypothetical protein [Acinetobacter shaoyimingii]|uniref:hypothetical protein n=1 Tax=Acinetobacter shaoyimingii TaxID=2715164 RepID=UPI0038783EEF